MGEVRYRYSTQERQLSLASYNAIIGAVLIWGLIISAVMIEVAGPYFSNWNIGLFVLLAFVVAMLGIAVGYAGDNPLVSFLGYNIVASSMGSLLGVYLQDAKGFSIMNVLAITAGVMVVMLVLGTMRPELFIAMRRILFFSLIVLLIAQAVYLLFGWNYPVMVDIFAAALFSCYIAHDWAEAQRKPHTANNAIVSCISLYVDAVNLFIRLASLSDRRKK